MHIKATMRYHLTPIRTADVKKSTNKKYFQGYKEREPRYTVDGNVNFCRYCGKQNGPSQKLKIELQFYSWVYITHTHTHTHTHAHTHTHTHKPKPLIQKGTYIPIFVAS